MQRGSGLMLPEWSDKFSVHNEIIDEQHQRLFELAHRAYKVANRHTDREQIRGIIAEFFDYMKTHFRDEEQYMHAIGYSRLEEHKKIHRAIVADMASMVKNVRSTNEIKDQILIIAKDWLLTHILQEDMQIERFRKAHTKSTDKIYTYICACPSREHKLTESMHIFIKSSARKVLCKECQQPIVPKDT
ncbi:hemerythrin family protein [Helicobacter typhlonius]|uniref:hemerythrin family protein n=2 Tax=Helicobacteraceae TaxID=72293 RepID=UPI002FDFA239